VSSSLNILEKFSYLALLCCLAALPAVAHAQAYESQVQEMYVAYYGRPGDPGGIDFWAQQLEQQGGNLGAIIDAFGNSDEYLEQFGSLSHESLVNNIFQQLFSRDADPGGLEFYVSSLQNGERSLASIALDVSNGVPGGSEDAAILANKLQLADYFTESVQVLDVSYGGDQVDDAQELLAAVGASQASLDSALDATLPLVSAFPPNSAEDPFDYFVAEVSDDVLQGICIACHVDGGAAQGSRLVYVPATNPDYHNLNYQQWVALAEEQEDLTGYALLKAQGLNGHGGGVQAPVGSDAYLALEGFLQLLAGGGGSTPGEELFAGYALASDRATLRRGLLLIAGELPGEDQQDAVASGGEAALRSALRTAMNGEGFHKFIVEGANDRLLTDKWIEDKPFELFFQPFYPDLANHAAELSEGTPDENEIYLLIQGISWGMARQPLELIAHVVENELPYTEILTAPYTMVNPQLALAYRSDVEFGEEDWDIDQWEVATVEGYTRVDESSSYEEADDFGAYISGGLATDYPHAGILNTPGWLARYPSTATNRNRARSRWTWYHFMGFDIERSARRSTDPDALADTDNPTLKNPNCVVCHEVMDPVAGAYQNYGDDGYYKDKFGGVDSLPRLYKQERDSEDPYQPGDTWYRDMRSPGLDGQVFTDTEATLQSLAAAIVSDHRFAVGTVKFWWPALMGEEAARAPEEESDLDYTARLALFQAQSADIEALASDFEQGFHGGAPYNLKDLLLEMMLSPWFRLDSKQGGPAVDDVALLGVGSGKLLTPEQLDRKTEAVTGFRWYEDETYGVATSQLDNAYRLFYGGIDSDGVTVRATEMTALMSTVVEAQPLQMACVLVGIEFNLPRNLRTMFTLVSRGQHEGNAEAVIRDQLVLLHQRFLGEALAANDPEIDRALQLFTETRAERISNGFPARLNGNARESCPFQFIDTSDWDLSDDNHSLNSWITMLIYYMTDYRYVYE
jgi:hypothetical protein